MGNSIVLEPTLKLSLTNCVTLNEFSWWSNLANTFTSTCCVGTDSLELKPFTRICSFWPVELKAVLDPPRPMSGYNRNLRLQEQWSRLCVNFFFNRSTGSSPVSFLKDGDPATFDDEVCGLFRFGGALLFEFDWLVLFLIFNSLFADLTLKVFSAPCNKTLWVLSQPGIVHLRDLGHFRNMWSGCKQAKHNLLCEEN